jgi:thioredoxin-related protein
MKTFAACLLMCLGLLAAHAEAQWLTDLEKAQAKAKAEGKMVLLDFTGSDWCPPCKQLHSKVLTSKEFEEFAQKNLVLVEVDFPRNKTQTEEQKKANRALAKKFNIEGYPTIVVLSKDGKELKKDVGYSGQSASEFVADLAKLKSS